MYLIFCARTRPKTFRQCFALEHIGPLVVKTDAKEAPLTRKTRLYSGPNVADVFCNTSQRSQSDFF